MSTAISMNEYITKKLQVDKKGTRLNMSIFPKSEREDLTIENHQHYLHKVNPNVAAAVADLGHCLDKTERRNHKIDLDFDCNRKV